MAFESVPHEEPSAQLSARKSKRRRKECLSPPTKIGMLLVLLFALIAVASLVGTTDSSALLYIGQRSSGGMYLAYSVDGHRFMQLSTQDGLPLLAHAVRKDAFREPAFCQMMGGTFHLLWMAGPMGNSSGFLQASSVDLRHWSTEEPVVITSPSGGRGPSSIASPTLLCTPGSPAVLIFSASSGMAASSACTRGRTLYTATAAARLHHTI